MKKLVKISFVFILLLVVTACGNNNISDSLRFKKEYESLNDSSVVMNIEENNPIKYLNFDETIEFLSSGTGVIYFGFPGCPWCRNMLPVLFEVASNNNIDTVYYFNPGDIRKNEDENYKKIITLLDKYLEKNEEGEKTLFVPDVYFVKNGEIVGHHLSTVDSQTDPFVSLTDEQIEELKTIYQDLFNKLK